MVLKNCRILTGIGLEPVHEKNTAPGGRGVIERIKPAQGLQCVNNEHFAVFVVTAGRAGDVRRHFGAALRAGLEQGCFPALGATTHFLAALGLTAFWYGHGSR